MQVRKPIVMNGKVRKRRDWLPRWEDCTLSIVDVNLSYSVNNVVRCSDRIEKVSIEKWGKWFGFGVETNCKKILHFAVEEEWERRIWMQMMQKALTLVDCPSRNGLYTMELEPFYEEWGYLLLHQGDYADWIPNLHPSITISSNYSHPVPMCGTFHGIEGLLRWIKVVIYQTKCMKFRVNRIVREKDLAIVQGRETIRNLQTGQCFRQTWMHEIRFAEDGRISHLHIKGDVTAARICFSKAKSSAILSHPKDEMKMATTCPPGTLRVVCIQGRALKNTKRSIRKSMLYVTLSISSFVGKGQDCQKTKAVAGITPQWTQMVELKCFGGVPGTPVYLYVQIWDAANGDELMGLTKINLADYYFLAAGSSTEQAAIAMPKWHSIYKDAHMVHMLKESMFTPQIDGMAIQLGISFEFKANRNKHNMLASSSYRASIDRLDELRDLTLDESSLVDERARSSSFDPALHEKKHSFTVAGTTFTIYERYQLIRSIGHGAYGSVVAVSDQLTGESVAIKNIPNTFADLIDAKRIVREIKLMQHFDHPNIIKILDLIRPPSLQNFVDTYIVSELLETDLHRVIHSKEGLSEEHIRYIMYQLLCAVQYLHSARVMHRDLKPSNVLINRDCKVKLCDFGLARGVRAEDEDMALTEYVVTRWYRAPELLLSSKYTTKLDAWSVGCIFAELYLRRPLFPGHDHVHQIKLITKVLGTPTADELTFVTNDKAKKWMLRQEVFPKKSLSEVLPSIPTDTLELLKQLITIDPHERMTISDAIQHSIFEEYRDDACEIKAKSVFNFDFESGHLEKDTLQRLIFEEICKFHPAAREELHRAK